jgi:UDP-N-acetylmuramoylalanine--D-glutamate ligase
MTRGELPLLGRHNLQNALAAAQMAVDFGVEPAVVRRALSAYRPLPHRLAIVGSVDGVTWIDDSKATSPNAATAGLMAIETPVVMLLGGSSKDADFSELAALVRRRTRAAVCFGATREAIAQALGDHPKAVVETLPEAVAAARAFAVAGDTVLLSPACASFDQFRGYAHRGEVFSQLVSALAGSC